MLLLLLEKLKYGGGYTNWLQNDDTLNIINQKVVKTRGKTDKKVCKQYSYDHIKKRFYQW